PRPRLPPVINARLPTSRNRSQIVMATFAPEISINEATCQRVIGIDAPIAKERPIAAHLVDPCQVEIRDEHLIGAMPRAGQHLAEGIADHRSSPEFESLR